MKGRTNGLRPDLALIAEWIEPGSRILDLGCGDGALLAHLAKTRNVRGYGLEIDPDNIARCLAGGVNVIEADVDDGLKDFGDASFDYVVMSGALQAMQHPDRVVSEILRVGRTGIVTFPNFGHWRVRLALALRVSHVVVSGIDDFDVDSTSADLSVSKGFAIVTPYAGVGYTSGAADPSAAVTAATGLTESEVEETKLFAGLRLSFGLFEITPQFTQIGDVSSYSARLGFSFGL